MLQFIKERLCDYSVSNFVNELFEASKGLGRLEVKVDSYRFNRILVPMLHKREAISSMYIEGTQTTISDVFENEVSPKSGTDKTTQEVHNHSKTLVYGADYLRMEDFSNEFIQKLHELMLTGIIDKNKENTLGKYKTKKNYIVNSVGTVVFEPPSEKETKKYMDELIAFMNDTNDGINPLIKAAIIHSQFESIHPFEDGNGRVGRLLISLYLFKAKVINVPFFYLSEAISQDKAVYYNRLADTRKNSYDEWIKFFLQKIVVQSSKHIRYVDLLNQLYEKTRKTIQESTKSARCDDIVECLFTHPVLTSVYLSERIGVSSGQAKRYLNVLEEQRVLLKNDRQRNQMFYFEELLDLARSY